jgi:hypothetical protein
MMPEDMRLWQITDGDKLVEIHKAKLSLEARLETWLQEDISLIADDLLVIHSQFTTDFGGLIDLLCLDQDGDLVVVELKRDRTPREITAQVLDYASAVRGFSTERIVEFANRYLRDNGPLARAFRERFGIELPDVLNERQRVLVVGSEIDSATERIVHYLSDAHNVPINVATFNYFHYGGSEYLARTLLLDSAHPQDFGGEVLTKRAQRIHDLEQMAIRNGVGPLCRELVDGLEPQFDVLDPQRYAMRFWGSLQGGRRVLFRLMPGESGAHTGVKFHVYTAKFAEYFKFTEQQMLMLLPSNTQEWSLRPDDPQWAGHEGFFRTSEEIMKLLRGLQAGSSATPG